MKDGRGGCIILLLTGTMGFRDTTLHIQEPHTTKIKNDRKLSKIKYVCIYKKILQKQGNRFVENLSPCLNFIQLTCGELGWKSQRKFKDRYFVDNETQWLDKDVSATI